MDAKLKVNRHKPFEDPERAEVEAKVINMVENDSERLLKKYCELPASMNGRYINSDLFKEIFDEYNSSPAHRTVFNVPVHNSAAVLANELFKRKVAEKIYNGINSVLFITGIPGAGKSTSIKTNKIDLEDYKVIYEGQLSTYEQAKEKIQLCVDMGCDVTVYSFHQKPEVALKNTFSRFNSIGRGASITAMSTIQGNLGESIEKLQNDFGKDVTFCVIDLRHPNSQPQCGPESISILKSEGDTHAIRQRLESELEKWRLSGRITEPCYREAAGRSPYSLAKMQEIHEKFMGDGCKASRQPQSTDGTCENAMVEQNEELKKPAKKKRLRMR